MIFLTLLHPLFLCIPIVQAGGGEEERRGDIILGSLPPYIKPFINVNPSSHILHFKPGNPFQLECNAVGVPSPKISWSRNGTSIPQNAFGLRRSGALLMFYEPMAHATPGHYQCFAENPGGRAFSEIAVLRTDSEKESSSSFPSSPRIVNWISHERMGALGDPYELMCAVDGSPGTLFTWSFNGEVVLKGTDNPMVIRIEALRAGDMGSYVCNASNPWGYDLRGLSLRISEEPPIIDLQPIDASYFPFNYTSDIFLEVGGNLSCLLLGGFPPPMLSWTLDSRDPPSSIWSQESLSSIISPESDGLYSCTAVNPLGAESLSLNVTLLRAPLILEGPQNVSGRLGGSVYLNCSVLWPEEHLKMEVSWRRHETEEIFEDHRTRLREDGLILKELRKSDAGKYTCTSSSSRGYASASAYLSIESRAPRILEGPGDITTSSGSTVILPCSIEGGGESALVSWKSSNHREPLKDVENKRIHVREDGSLVLSEVRPSDSGIYTCSVPGEGPSLASGFLNVRRRTRILEGPMNVAYKEGMGQLKLDCLVSVDDFLVWSLELSWDKDGEALESFSSGDGIEILENGTLILEDLTEEDIGTYTCTAKTSVDVVRASGRIYIPVIIDWFPVGATLCLGMVALILSLLFLLLRRSQKEKGERSAPLASLEEDGEIGPEGLLLNGMTEETQSIILDGTYFKSSF